MRAISEMDFEIDQLQLVTRTFHLLHHRNKNQHRHSKWWKWVSILKRCVSKLIYEYQSADSLRAQARAEHMSKVLLPRCFESFTQLILDTQFSALGLILVAELSRIWRLVGVYDDRAENNMSIATEPVNGRDTLFSSLFEDFGEAVGRNASRDPTHVGIHAVRASEIHTGPKCGKGTYKRLHEREGIRLDATTSADNETEVPHLRAGAVIWHAPAAPLKRQRQWKSVNPIEDLFEGLN